MTKNSYCDNTATVDDLKNAVSEFCEERDWDQFHNPKDLAIGISTEANELLQIFRFKSQKQQVEAFQDEKIAKHIREELADTLYFILRFADMNHIDLASSLIEKIKLDGEKYPVSLSKGRNEKYTELKKE